MAPEQATGEVEIIDGRADLYALGAMLFEILTLQPLHEGRNTEELIAKTLAGANASVSERAGAPAVPELEAICVKATALDPEERYEHARQMHEAVESYLDGDRDLQRRRDMARQHALNAQQALADADANPAQGAQARSRAMRELNAALTLDPTNEGALATMMQVLVGSAGDMPADAEAELERVQQRGRIRGARRAAIAMLSLYLFAPLLLWLGVRSHLALALMGVLILAAAGASYWISLQSRMKPPHFYLVSALPMALAGLTGLICGPLVLVPGAVLAMGLPVIVNVRASRAQRIYMGTLGVLAVLLPLGLQQLGWLPPFYELQDGVITILPWTVDFPSLPTHLFLVIDALAIIVVPLIVIGSPIDALKRAERRLFAQAWNLRQLVPDEAQRAVGENLAAAEEPSTRCPV
jgi:serine/threonine-protein kinase